MDCINYCMRQDGEHRWCYDEETMRLPLESVGFVEIQRREFDSELDQELRRNGSLYMRCRKPRDYLHDLQSAVVRHSSC
jgi:hypothetical protein